ncbi:alpha/beta hydrolase [uncultured Piscinibacter sp.]|uniref:alpha/beta hydrolase n=1 Tax=uncultured Piscinibacter sp. TaxID=1131835 RepID=UPI00262BFCAA|nr:alpha/beta hydrolase [uncultured Piscinibacter sp.]
MAGLLERIRRANRPAFHTMTPAEARVAYVAAAEVLDLPRAKLARVENLQLPGAGAAMLDARRYRAGERTRGTLLYLHGGGFTIGGLETHDSLCRQLALHSDAEVLALDYRLAPEHRFPTAVEDAWTALRWLWTEGRTFGFDAARLAVGGDSAGGTLAAVAAILARDHGLPLRAQLLVSPGTTAHADTASHRLFANGFLLDATTIEWFFEQYIERSQRSDWRFAPLNAHDLEGVAPACVVLAECDPLCDEGIAYADRLRAAGVAVTLDLVRGVTHDFIKMGRVLDEARHAQATLGAALRKAFEP